MTWFWIGCAALLVFFIGVFLCERGVRLLILEQLNEWKQEMDRLKEAQVEDRELVRQFDQPIEHLINLARTRLHPVCPRRQAGEMRSADMRVAAP